MKDLIELLDEKGIEYQKTNNAYEILLYCTSGEHQDNSPSLSYNIEKHIFQCWSCGFKGGLSKYLSSVGITETIDTSSKQPYRIKKLADRITELRDLNSFAIPSDAKKFKENFGGIDAAVLEEFGAFTSNEMYFTDYVCIPIHQFGRLRFIEGRITRHLDHEPKYKRKPAKAVVSDCLFPLDRIGNQERVILVEGLFDMLNMWQLGFTNTLCIFGTNNFNASKVNILDRLGVTHVDIMMDGDMPGRKAAEKIQSLLDKKDIFSKIVMLPQGLDPGELNYKQAKYYLTAGD